MFPLYDLNPHRRFPWLTVVIIAANVAVQVWMSGFGPQDQQRIALRYGVVPKRLSAVDSGQPVTLPVQEVEVDPRNGQRQIVEKGRERLPTDASAVYLTLLTTMFLHGGWLHLLSNMWILWIFGNNIEDRLGHSIYVAYYLLGGVVASFCHYFTDMQSDMPVVGASGAVAAVLGGYAITYPWAKVRTIVFIGLIMVLDIPALVWLGIWFVTQNVIPALAQFHGVVRDPVAYWAHIGGFLAGIALMPLFSLGASPPEADWRKEAEEQFRFDDPRQRNW